MKNKKLTLIITLSIILIITTTVIYSATTKKHSIEALSTKISSLTELETTYKIENTEEYNNLLAAAKDAVNSKNLDKITSITSELIKFEENLLSSNTESLTSIIASIKKIDISKLKSKSMFQESLKIIENLQSKKDFKFAIEKAIALKESIEKEKTTFDATEKKKAEAAAKEKAKKDAATKAKALENQKLASLLKAFNYATDSNFNQITPIEYITIPAPEPYNPNLPKDSYKKTTLQNTNNFIIGNGLYNNPSPTDTLEPNNSHMYDITVEYHDKYILIDKQDYGEFSGSSLYWIAHDGRVYISPTAGAKPYQIK